jgi:HK97 family phage prohead protease
MITFRSTTELRQNKDGDTTIAVINSKSLDRHGTVIDPAGVSLANYNRNPVFLINHDYGILAGNGANVRYQDDKLIAEVPDDAWDKEDPDVMKWYRKVKSGKMKMTSIGFTYDYDDVEEEERLGEDGKSYRVPVIRKSELLEFSFVTVGSNPDALVLQRTAHERSLDVLKSLEEKVDEYISKIDKLADRDFIRTVFEELAETKQPKQSVVTSPEKEKPTPAPVSRSALIQQEIVKQIIETKRKRGQL